MSGGMGVSVLDGGQGGLTMIHEGGKEMSHMDIWGESAPNTEDTDIQTALPGWVFSLSAVWVFRPALAAEGDAHTLSTVRRPHSTLSHCLVPTAWSPRVRVTLGLLGLRLALASFRMPLAFSLLPVPGKGAGISAAEFSFPGTGCSAESPSTGWKALFPVEKLQTSIRQ